jgi:hypothetical protein
VSAHTIAIAAKANANDVDDLAEDMVGTHADLETQVSLTVGQLNTNVGMLNSTVGGIQTTIDELGMVAEQLNASMDTLSISAEGMRTTIDELGTVRLFLISNIFSVNEN